MRLIIQSNRIAATATDDYTGPDQHIAAPEDFDPERMADYVYAAGVLALPGQPSLQEQVVAATQQRLDDFARTRNYDGILSACTYATSTVPRFAAEGQYAATARDATWAALYALLADVQAGARPAPASFGDVQPLLPDLEWPNATAPA